MKKILFGVLALILVLGIIGCSNTQSQAETKETVKENTTPVETLEPTKEVVKTAFEQLNDEERQFVRVFIKHVYDFKDPYSVQVLKRSTGTNTDSGGYACFVMVSATNSYGGRLTETYTLSDKLGFVKASFPVGLGTVHIDLINKAIEERR